MNKINSVNGTLGLITSDTLAKYGEVLDERIRDSLAKSSGKVYTGDIVNYFLGLVANNINNLMTCEPNEVTNALQSIVGVYLSSYGVINAKWTEGWQYVIMR